MVFFVSAEEFSKMKDEVPPSLVDAHIKSVQQAMKEGKSVDEGFGLEKSGIAGTDPSKDEESQEKKEESKEGEKKEKEEEKKEGEDKKEGDEKMEVEEDKDKETDKEEGDKEKEKDKEDTQAEVCITNLFISTKELVQFGNV